MRVAASTDAAALHAQCVAEDVAVVGIDAPCQWGIEGEERVAERELARERIAYFATPTQARAEASTSAFYEWIFNGERVYHAFADSQSSGPAREPLCGHPVSVETFPHAITCALLGRDAVSAKLKRVQRRELLAALGFDGGQITSIDSLDAALCAFTAQCLIEGETRAYGGAPAADSSSSPTADRPSAVSCDDARRLAPRPPRRVRQWPGRLLPCLHGRRGRRCADRP
ncbi:hypothetical protein BRCH_00275c [Candidatus Burkholderia brachyanthoides]|nr:hypothetical protein BRCH_00275c [Candidatus Burkholderia brachyanthoides]